MTDEMALEKAKAYLIKLKKSKLMTKRAEIIEINKVIENLDSICLKMRIERKKNNI